jgi:hypothetical protein
MAIKKLPVFKLVLPEDDEDLGIQSVALVKSPAIQVDFVTFSETDVKRKTLQLAIQDNDDQICIGPLLIPDQMIYRNDVIDGEHYVTIDKDTILQASIRFAQKNNGNKVDLEHDGQLVKGVTMIGNYISNRKYGLSAPAAFSHLPDGTWFVQYHITDPAIWQSIKDNTFEGFSITGLFEEELEQLCSQLEKAILDLS